jgi:hypothetical protein
MPMVGSVEANVGEQGNTCFLFGLPWLPFPFGRALPMGWQGSDNDGRFCHEPGLYHESMVPENQAVCQSFGFTRCHDDLVMVAKPLCMA